MIEKLWKISARQSAPRKSCSLSGAKISLHVMLSQMIGKQTSFFVNMFLIQCTSIDWFAAGLEPLLVCLDLEIVVCTNAIKTFLKNGIEMNLSYHKELGILLLAAPTVCLWKCIEASFQYIYTYTWENVLACTLIQFKMLVAALYVICDICCLQMFLRTLFLKKSHVFQSFREKMFLICFIGVCSESFISHKSPN